MDWKEGYLGFLRGASVNRWSTVGVVMVTVITITFLVVQAAMLIGLVSAAYIGLVLYLAFPLFFLTGLALIPFGWWLHARRTGQDLRQMVRNRFRDQDVQARIYAGLDSETVKALEGIQFAAITEQRLRYKLTNFLFLPEELEDLDTLLKETAAAFAGDAVYLAHLHTFDAFFELIVRVKKRCQIKNSAAAFLKLLELARIGLEQIMKEEAAHGS